jgi:hypothetical protein
MNKEDRDNVLREIRKWRRKELVEALDSLAESAILYHAEQQRSDNAHIARLEKRRASFEACIRWAHQLLP